MKMFIGHNQVTRRKFDLVLRWVIRKAIELEGEKNVPKASEIVLDLQAQGGSTVINSHRVYTIKDSETGTLKEKGPKYMHANGDEMKVGLRKDSGTAQFFNIWLMVYIATCMNAKRGLVDITGAYIKSDLIMR